MERDLDRVAKQNDFSGVVGIEVDGVVTAHAYGFADRSHAVANTTTHRLGTASGTKTLTAIAVLSASAGGLLDLDSPVRELLGDDLPLVDDRSTIRHLLNHRSGIGDYFDESADIDRLDYAMSVPVHTLDSAAGYLAALGGYEQKFTPGTDFAYCNSGYVLLGILLERTVGMHYSEIISERVTGPAGMSRTEFLRMDALPGDAATGYVHVEGLRTNVLHLPVVGFGDGGIFTTVEDVHRLWSALVAGRLGDTVLAMMTAPPEPGARYGMGMWLDKDDKLSMTGMDVGASFHSTRWADGTTFSVLSNTSHGAWVIAEHLDQALGDRA